MHKFKVEVLRSTHHPQQLLYQALHQDYSEHFITEENQTLLQPPHDDEQAARIEKRCGEIAIERLLKGGRGHFGVFEHPCITFACGNFPHSTMYQARTHRIASFDVQSGRYTGIRFTKVLTGELDVEDVFYFRPVGIYNDRSGKRFEYTEEIRTKDLAHAVTACSLYKSHIDQGMPYEQARSIIPFELRQHFVFSLNMRSLMHFLDLRCKADSQLEMQKMAYLMLDRFKSWAPEIATWYEHDRLQKAKLSP